jgi:hypothetical protein
MVNNQSLIVDICPEDADKPQRSVVDISAECFYPLEASTEVPKTEMDKVTEEITETFSAPISTPEAVPQRASSY